MLIRGMTFLLMNYYYRLNDTLEDRQQLRKAFIKCDMGDYPMIDYMQFVPGWILEILAVSHIYYHKLNSKKIKMSFKTYIKNIEDKTGKTAQEIQNLAEEKGFSKNGEISKNIKATEISNWLKEEFELGHGHAMAMYAYIKGKRE